MRDLRKLRIQYGIPRIKGGRILVIIVDGEKISFNVGITTCIIDRACGIQVPDLVIKA